MLQKLILDGVGPAKHLEVEFAERLNLITGDNGLGKSFLLDVAWWALTGGWLSRDRTAVPRKDAETSELAYSVWDGSRSAHENYRFLHSSQIWYSNGGTVAPGSGGPVIYAQVDGGFAVWDSARNGPRSGFNAQPPVLFDPKQIWIGLTVGESYRCNGLYRDWASWQLKKGEAFAQLERVLRALSPPEEPITPGPLQRVFVDDSLDYPTLQMPYGVTVPVIHASAAMRRILALSYLLVWTWQEHLRASEILRSRQADKLVLLVDEVEAHLHPSWQRRILPALLDVVAEMTGMETPPRVQIIATTHSPIVCTSIEPIFDAERDQLLDMNFDRELGIQIEQTPFVKRGSVERWLLSPQFDMKSTYSERVERAIADAESLLERERMSPGSMTKDQFDAQTRELADQLDELNPFWVLWQRTGEKRGWLR